MLSSDQMIPTVLFFLVFFIAFLLLELLLILALRRFAAGHWVFFIDRIIRFQLHHQGALRVFAYGSLLGIAGVLLVFTPLLAVLRSATPELQGLAGGLLVMMIVIYFVTRRATMMAIERRLQAYCYVLISLFLYVGLMLAADGAYGRYKEWVNTALVNPTVRQVNQTLDEQQKEALLNQFRGQAARGECQPVDYETAPVGAGVKHFVLIDGPGDSTELKGLECTDGENTFLLKENGSWYWIISSGM